MVKLFAFFKTLVHHLFSILALKIIVLIAIVLLYFGRAFNDFPIPYIEGDGIEYVLMTEAFYNHFSPDIRKQDVQTFRERATKDYGWSVFPKGKIFDDCITFFANHKPLNDKYDVKTFSDRYSTFFYRAKNDKFYSYHFFSYSAFCMPVRVVCEWFNIPVLKTYTLTNALLVSVVCFLLLFWFTSNPLVNIMAALCFCFGSQYWYLGWEHTEIFSTCLVAIGMICFFKEKPFLSLLFIAIATSQTQALLILLLFVGVWFWRRHKFSWQFLLKSLPFGLLAIVPPLFYYYHFGVTSIIKEMGYLDSQYIGLGRLFSFYFDFNQGMILALPVILLSYLVLWMNEVITCIRKRQLKPGVFLPLVCIIMTLIVSSMAYWNPGQTIVHRYTTWVGAIIFIHTFIMVAEMENDKYRTVLLNNFFVSQIFVCFYFSRLIEFDYEQLKHNPFASWVLKKYADFYNPDPAIFKMRTSQEMDKDHVYAYFDEDKIVKKILVKKESLDSLVKYGLKTKVKKRLLTYPDQYGWIYLKERDLETLKNSYYIFDNIVRVERKQLYMEKYKNDKQWLASIQGRLAEGKVTFEQLLDEVAEYFVKEDERMFLIRK
jgi:hypothetical protein